MLWKWAKWKGRCCSFPVLYSDLLRAHQLKLDKHLHVKPPGKIYLLTEMVLGMLLLSLQYWTNTFSDLSVRASVSFELSHLLLTHPRNRNVQFSILAKCCGMLTENNTLITDYVLSFSKVLDCAVITLLNSSYSMMDGLKFIRKAQITVLLMEQTKVFLGLSDLSRRRRHL